MTNPIVYRRIFVVPAAGRHIIDPETNRPIPPEGALVLDNKYYRRRIAEGDVVETVMSDAVNTAKAKNSSKKEK